MKNSINSISVPSVFSDLSVSFSAHKLLIPIIFLCVGLSYYPSIDIYSFGDYGIHLYHIFIFAFIPFLIMQPRITLPPKSIIALYVLAIIVSFVNIKSMGINQLLVIYIFYGIVLLSMINMPDDISLDSITLLLAVVTIIFAISNAIALIIHFDNVLEYLRGIIPNHPPLLNWNQSMNVDSSYLALLCIFLLKYPKANAVCLSFTLFLSLCFGSRAGLIAVTLVSIWAVIHTEKKKQLLAMLIILYIIVISSILVLSSSSSGIDSSINISETSNTGILSRFAKIGHEPGSMGRMSLWREAFNVVLDNPVGFGIGNNVNAMELITGNDLHAGNVHNLFIQQFVDIGIAGGILYLIVVIVFVVRNIRQSLFKSPFAAWIGCYFVLGMIQFRGGDLPMLFILGCYFLERKRGGANYLSIPFFGSLVDKFKGKQTLG
jgi:hypothetical protein